MLTVSDLVNVASKGGISLAISLGLVLIAIWRGWLEVGVTAQRERQFLQTYADQMRAERDAFKAQVDARQNLVEQTVELANLMKAYAGDGPAARKRN